MSLFKLSSSVFAGLLTSACVIADGSEAVSRDQPVSSGATEKKEPEPAKKKSKKKTKEETRYVEGCGLKDKSGDWVKIKTCVTPPCRDGWVVVKEVVPARMVNIFDCVREL
ncbi:MAG: hypothetical protein WCL28_00280 [bacterium]